MKKRELSIFLILVYAVPAILSVFMLIAYGKGWSRTLFPIAWMFVPAAVVMVIILLQKETGTDAPKPFFYTFIVFSLLMALLAMLSSLIDTESNTWVATGNILVMAASLVCLTEILSMGKEKRSQWGLSFTKNSSSAIIGAALFLVLYFIVTMINTLLYAILMGISLHDAFAGMTFNPSGVFLLLVNFPLSFIMFFGEEYGWRYYLQPRLQRKFGLRRGVVFVGLLWGIWHLPLNYLYYSPETGLYSLIGQMALCVGLGVFFGWLYIWTENIWVVTLAHYLQNNIGALLFGVSSKDVVWDVLGVAAGVVALLVVYLPFLLCRKFKEPASIDHKSRQYA